MIGAYPVAFLKKPQRQVQFPFFLRQSLLHFQKLTLVLPQCLFTAQIIGKRLKKRIGETDFRLCLVVESLKISDFRNSSALPERRVNFHDFFCPLAAFPLQFSQLSKNFFPLHF